MANNCKPAVLQAFQSARKRAIDLPELPNRQVITPHEMKRLHDQCRDCFDKILMSLGSIECMDGYAHSVITAGLQSLMSYTQQGIEHPGVTWHQQPGEEPPTSK